MAADAEFKSLFNGQATPRKQVPLLPLGTFRRAVLEAVQHGQRVAAFFGHAPESGGRVELYAVLADKTNAHLNVASAWLDSDEFPSLTPDCPQVHLFEREIAEQFGVKPLGHPWLKPVRFHESYRPGHDAWARSPGHPVVGVMDYYQVESEEIHEVAVGPVHAGVIEPGHFRFQCHGEQVYHLEISLGYQHRGVEMALKGGPNKRTLPYMETLAGDTTIGHASAYCQNVEALTGVRPSLRAMAIRGIGLELERLANHTGDVGALANDVGYLPTASYCGRLRGDFLNATAAICGNRFGRGLVKPGGVGFDIEEALASDLRPKIQAALKDVAGATKLLWESSSVMARFQETGTLEQEDAKAIGLVGPAARACGLDPDVRQDFPFGIYRFNQVPVSICPSGDVFARAYVRWLEIQRSGEFVLAQLKALPAGGTMTLLKPLQPNMLAVSLVEGWRGEICHVALTDDQGKFARYKVVDPSFHNWYGLALALREQQISDFPLCNKSFNLSYCGHDL
ncbi:MAG TPA: NADH-quinone oxidoreductase subunit C [Gemmataceae bacterium]|nr:NADH-quinone oxidoreductase subunit C [Gemmataceae bacterium]